MTFYLINLGCKVNFADLSQIKSQLLENNFTLADTVFVADIVLINTCAVTNQAAQQCRQVIRRTKKQNPDCFVGVLGCYAQIAAEDIMKTTGADAVFGTNEKFNIPLILKELASAKAKTILVSNPIKLDFYVATSCGENLSFKENAKNTTPTPPQEGNMAPTTDGKLAKGSPRLRTRAFLKLQDGCSYKCSYCVVPLARGASRSINFNLIPEQINKLIAAGYKEIVVSGINLSDYRSDSGEQFIDLLKLLAGIDKHCNVSEETDIRFRISSIEPQVISPEVVDIIANSKYICPHFHIPLQSGSDAVLQKMRRRYNTEQFRRNIELINQYMPLAFIGLDVICGFPTETEEDFCTTKDFVSSLNITALHCFTYSAKQNTDAALMPQIPKQQKKQRTNELIEISSSKQQHFYEKNIGNTLIFLPEKYDEANKLTWGYTENYIRVGVSSEAELVNKFYPITTTGCSMRDCCGARLFANALDDKLHL